MKAAEKFKEASFWIAAIALAYIFIWYAGIDKIKDPGTFARNVANYKLLPLWMVNIVAIALPWVEVICGVTVLYRRLRVESAIVLFLLSLVFFIAVSSALARGLDISCGCSATTAGKKLGTQTLLLDSLCLVLSGWIIWGNRSRKESPSLKTSEDDQSVSQADPTTQI